MDTRYNVGVTLSAEEVESILKDHIRASTGLDVSTVKINFKKVHHGSIYPNDSWTEHVFDGATVAGVAVNHKQFYAGGKSSLAAQIAAVEAGGNDR